VTTKHEPALYDLFHRDAEIFNLVILARTSRDAATDETARKLLKQEELGHLRTATEIPLDIVRHSLDLARLALTLFDIGFKAARGDSGAAASSALSGASSALFVTYLNLKTFRDSKWARGVQEQCDVLFEQYRTVNTDLFSRVTTLRGEVIEAQKLHLELELPVL